MFTGLIETTGTLLALKPSAGAMRLIIAAPQLTGRWKVGDSIAVNGVCLTAIDLAEPGEPHPGRFAADLAEETIRRTTLTRLQPGSLVNLELPTPAGSPLGGHVVQGHVDGTATMQSIVPVHTEDLEQTDWRMTVQVSPELAAHIIPQGSVTIDGISLTVAKQDGLRIEIAVIPHTYKVTNLRTLLSGTPVNVETDVLSKYAAKKAAAEGSAATLQAPAAPELHPAVSGEGEWLTPEYLLANGY